MPACLSVFSLLFFPWREHPGRLSFAGQRRFALDPEDVGVAQEWGKRASADELRLPGSLQEQGWGKGIGMGTLW